ncbi:MAG TPA: FtsX-like permease family protein, partial [Gemmatimonadales bacterium]|nr:FtsX-like permease family protein [Gemmatimonadales bacterium]
SQFPSRGATIVLEPARQASAAVDAMRASLREVDPLVPTAVRTMEEITTAALALPRTYALLVGVFAAIALALAALGVYGVMAYAVTQRRHELGVRLALGAGPASIRQLVLREGAGLASIGLALGMIGAVAGSGLLRKLLFGVSDRDPVTLVAAPAVLAVLALLASWIPARRAARVDPLVAIREE